MIEEFGMRKLMLQPANALLRLTTDLVEVSQPITRVIFRRILEVIEVNRDGCANVLFDYLDTDDIGGLAQTVIVIDDVVLVSSFQVLNDLLLNGVGLTSRALRFLLDVYRRPVPNTDLCGVERCVRVRQRYEQVALKIRTVSEEDLWRVFFEEVGQGPTLLSAAYCSRLSFWQEATHENGFIGNLRDFQTQDDFHRLAHNSELNLIGLRRVDHFEAKVSKIRFGALLSQSNGKHTLMALIDAVRPFVRYRHNVRTLLHKLRNERTACGCLPMKTEAPARVRRGERNGSGLSGLAVGEAEQVAALRGERACRR
ncbi:hypothetical protein [Caballeronia sp. Sq4a]|uniref:hypothetical protein n=1 Tax=Caballeronia sp. Sq4a TaxID=2878152 RepID=UPI0020C06300|nr:hypothetical protein [Caballeronia sp. Sq4a]